MSSSSSWMNLPAGSSGEFPRCEVHRRRPYKACAKFAVGITEIIPNAEDVSRSPRIQERLGETEIGNRSGDGPVLDHESAIACYT